MRLKGVNAGDGGNGKNTEKDWKKGAFQIHVAFHQTALNPLTRFVRQVADEEAKKELEKISSQIHDLFDTVVMWVEKLSDQTLRLEGALEEARRALNEA